MAKIDIARSELVWPGKYNEDGTRKEVPRVSLPFQVIESINQSRATREATKVATPSLLQIPREVMEQQAVDKGDIQFFELAYLEVKPVTPKKRTVVITLKDFVISNTELVPEEVRSKIKKWSDYCLNPASPRGRTKASVSEFLVRRRIL